MPELKALAREHRLRGYSLLRKAELIELIQNNQQPQWVQQPQQPQQQQVTEQLTKRQLQHRRVKYTKSVKKFNNLVSQINNLKLRVKELMDKISHTSKLAHSGLRERE